jgi:demethoxyubiquinone hydroxylase (CLK1/Coq7/Cat5 family)
MPSSGMLHRVALVSTDVSEELVASIIRVTRIGELGATLEGGESCITRSFIICTLRQV